MPVRDSKPNSNNMKSDVEFRACRSSFVVLCSFGVAVGLLYIYVCIQEMTLNALPPAFLSFSVSGLFAFWLLGHRIRISGTHFLHRNGLYQTRKCDFSEIKLVKVETVQFERFRRDLGIPKIVVRFHDKSISPILINPKPFALDDLGTFWEIMEANGLCPVRKRAKSKKK